MLRSLANKNKPIDRDSSFQTDFALELNYYENWESMYRQFQVH